MIVGLLRRLGLAPPPDPRAAAFDAQCDLLLELARKHPERVVAFQQQIRACGVTINEAQESFALVAASGFTVEEVREASARFDRSGP